MADTECMGGKESDAVQLNHVMMQLLLGILLIFKSLLYTKVIAN